MLTNPAKSGGFFKELKTLYGSSKQRRVAFVCHFAYFSSAFSYYVTGNLNLTYEIYIELDLISEYSAINADNLSANKVIYVLSTGGVDFLAVFVNIGVFRNLGRRWACMIAFGLAGICMFALLVLPQGKLFSQ